MKVLHVIPSISPLRGGPSQAVLGMVSSLRQQGIDAEIATTNDHGPDLLDVPVNQLSQHEGIPVRFFPRFSPKISAMREFAFSRTFSSWLWQNITDYDLVHVHAIFSYPSTAAMTAARLQGVPYIARPLGQLCNWSLQQSKHKKQIYLNLLERNNLHHSCAIHFTSEQEQQEAAQQGFTTPHFILPHGLTQLPPMLEARSLLRRQLGLVGDEPIILFMSRLHPKKGLDSLIPALGQLQGQRFHLVIAGNGTPEYEAEVDRLVQAAGLAQRTHRLGFVNGKLKELLLQGSDLFALTSHSENFGIALLEALAAGLPVVTTPGVALASLVQRSQLGWVVPQEPLAIASTVRQGLQNPSLLRAMGDRARQIVHDTYSWQAIAMQLTTHYHGLLGRV